MSAARSEAHKVLAKVALSEEKRGSSADLPQKEKDEAQTEADETSAAASADTSKPSAEEQEKADDKAAADAKVGFVWLCKNGCCYSIRLQGEERKGTCGQKEGILRGAD